jgi:hypothetical protein
MEWEAVRMANTGEYNPEISKKQCDNCADSNGDGSCEYGFKSGYNEKGEIECQNHREASQVQCPKCRTKMAHGYHLIRSIEVASSLATYNENLLRAEDHLISHDQRRHIEGLRELRAVRDTMTKHTERCMEVIWQCPKCGHEEKVSR